MRTVEGRRTRRASEWHSATLHAIAPLYRSAKKMKISLHDNWLYAHLVDHDSRMIVLHTMYPHEKTPQFTDVVFKEVRVHHFETECMRATENDYPANVLFDIEEEDSVITLGRYWDFIATKRNYIWPARGWTSREGLAEILCSQGHRCFHIHGTVGLDGFVFARDMKLVKRPSKWQNQA